MRIVVTTPTGNVGSRVVRLLLQAGGMPVLLLRHPDRLDPDVRDGCEPVVADQRDGGAVVRATRGADALCWVDPPTGEDPPGRRRRRGGPPAVHSLVRSTGAGCPRPRGPHPAAGGRGRSASTGRQVTAVRTSDEHLRPLLREGRVE